MSSPEPSDYGDDERCMGCLEDDDYDPAELIYSAIDSSIVVDLPQSHDIRDVRHFHINNQKNTNSCVGHSVAAQLYYIHDTRQSPLFLYYNTRFMNNELDVDNGMTIKSCYKAIANWGSADLQYHDLHNSVYKSPTAECYLKARKLEQWKPIRMNGYSWEIMYYLYKYSVPIVLGMEIYESFMKLGLNGFYQPPQPHEVRKGRHCVCIIGYDQTERYFTLANSWGRSWSDEGFFRVYFDIIEDRSLFSDFWVLSP